MSATTLFKPSSNGSACTKLPILPGFRVYHIAEMLNAIVEAASWQALMGMTDSTTILRALVLDLVKKRVRAALGRFVPAAQLDGFWNLFYDTRAGVAGGIVRSIMSASRSEHQYVFPMHLDLVVPRGTGVYGLSRWRRFFGAAGYVQDVERPAHWWDFGPTFSRSATLRSVDNPPRVIRIIEAVGDNILPAILCGPHTSSFNVFTASTFYCFYPRLFLRDQNLVRKDAVNGEPMGMFNFGLTTYLTTGDMPMACGDACPAIWRNTFGLRGVGVFRWGGSLAYREAGEDGFEKRSYLWRIRGANDHDGHVCSNHFCPNVGFGRPLVSFDN
ncbi:hypothetical protein GALMADRAFT_143221 [Galerina marginata CBS 339.88]|uniref:Uncharacterized protein n=1 Tax=Galerina marginata (strain CBS 339.88) TaxID=685588 RepID=A0A067SNA2_GALM3|nr:hypothetical protein GALMADRAFT_143221 [Galerina marginata CBS 339.88]